MSNLKVFVTRQIPQCGLDLLQPHVDLEIWLEEQPPCYEYLKEKIQDLDGLLCLLTDKIDKSLIDAGKSLKVISQMAVGYDNIDVAAASEEKIPIGHTPGVLTDATADLTWALLMASARRLPESIQYVKEGKWQTWHPTLLLGADLVGATLGIIGLGRIGQAVARRAQGFGLHILYTKPHRLSVDEEEKLDIKYVSFEQLLQESDFVTLHAPLTQDTYHLIGRPQFSLMKETAILINTARGSLIDSSALYEALKNHQISAAAIDVTDPEPLPSNSPLLELSNLIVTPHIGSASQKTRSLMASIAAQNLLAGLRGEPLLHCVNPEIYS